MKVVTVRDFRDHESEMFRSHDVILATRDGDPAGFFFLGTRQSCRSRCAARCSCACPSRSAGSLTPTV
jgi:hypothetical protein